MKGKTLAEVYVNADEAKSQALVKQNKALAKELAAELKADKPKVKRAK